jgi:hypothetical protein
MATMPVSRLAVQVTKVRQALEQAYTVECGLPGRRHFAILSLAPAATCCDALAASASASLPQALLDYDIVAAGCTVFSTVQARLAELVATFGRAVPAPTLRLLLGTAAKRYLRILHTTIINSPGLRSAETGGLDEA